MAPPAVPSCVEKLTLLKPRGRPGGPVRVDFEDWPGGRVLVTRFFECVRSGNLTSRVRVMSPEGAAIARKDLFGYR